MICLKRLLVCCALAILGGCPAAEGQHEPDFVAQARRSVVRISTSRNGKPIRVGCGFVISADGDIMTAWDVMSGATKAVVEFADGMSRPVIGLLGKDTARSLALIKVDASGLQWLAPGESKDIEQEDTVVNVGFQLGTAECDGEFDVTKVIRRGAQVIRFDVLDGIPAVNCGCPVLDTYGSVVGVAIIPGLQGARETVITSDEAKSFVAKCGSLVPLSGSAPAPHKQTVVGPAPSGTAEHLFAAGNRAMAAAEFSRAVRYFDAATRLKPKWAAVWLQAAEALYGCESDDDGVTLRARRGLALTVSDSKAIHENLRDAYGFILQYMPTNGTPDDYRREIDGAKFPAAMREAVEGLAGRVLAQADYSLGLVLAEQAVRLAGAGNTAWFHLAVAYVGLGRETDAQDAIKHGLSLGGNDAGAYADLGSVLFEDTTAGPNYLNSTRWWQMDAAESALKESIRLGVAGNARAAAWSKLWEIEVDNGQWNDIPGAYSTIEATTTFLVKLRRWEVARAYAETGNFAEATKVYQALKTAKDGTADLALGVIKAAQQDHDILSGALPVGKYVAFQAQLQPQLAVHARRAEFSVDGTQLTWEYYCLPNSGVYHATWVIGDASDGPHELTMQVFGDAGTILSEIKKTIMVSHKTERSAVVTVRADASAGYKSAMRLAPSGVPETMVAE